MIAQPFSLVSTNFQVKIDSHKSGLDKVRKADKTNYEMLERKADMDATTQRSSAKVLGLSSKNSSCQHFISKIYFSWDIAIALPSLKHNVKSESY